MFELHRGDCLDVLRTLPDGSVHCVVTSPPCWSLRDYGVEGQYGLEPTPDAYVGRLVAVFREARRVLRGDGTLWLNLGDSYMTTNEVGRNDCDRIGGVSLGKSQRARAERRTMNRHGLKPRDMVGIPWRVALALQSDGWYLRSDIIWHKPNPMPESVRDRPTKSHEYVFLLAKSARYHFDADAVKEAAVHAGKPARYSGPAARARAMGRRPSGNERPGMTAINGARRNIRSVWTIAPHPCAGAHFAVMPARLVEPCIRAGCPAGGTVLDPFAGSGTVGAVALSLSRSFVGIELNPEYIALARERIGAAMAARAEVA